MNKKKKPKISFRTVFNILVVGISVYLIIFFFVSEDGMIDLLRSPDGFQWGWILLAIAVFDANIFIDGVVTMLYIRSRYPDFSLWDALKTAFVGFFFGAVTPSNTGGQPMQLFLLSKKKISVGFGSACMTQKFIVYQLVTVTFSIFAVIVNRRFFLEAFTDFFSSAFIVLGFAVQLILTVFLLIVSFSDNLTKKLIRLIYKVLKLLKFIKNPQAKILKISREFAMFHKSSKLLMGNRKLMIKIFLLVFAQMLCFLSIPYFIYLSFGMPKIAAAHNLPVGNLFDFMCIQSFVLFTSNLVPLPGASGGAELAFTMYFGSFFVIGSIRKIKPAVLLWRFVAYYGAMLLTAPFSYFTKGYSKEYKQIQDKQRTAELIEENS